MDWSHDIKLNNRGKWVANKETTEGVLTMITHLGENNEDTIESYKLLGDSLNKEKNIIIEKCTMKGPSHDNLHVFLYPLIEKIVSLQKIETKEQGRKITSSIKIQLLKYQDYFQ